MIETDNGDDTALAEPVPPRGEVMGEVIIEGLPPIYTMAELAAMPLERPHVEVSNRDHYSDKSDEEIEQMGLVPGEPYDPEALLEPSPDHWAYFDLDRGVISTWEPDDERAEFDVRQIRHIKSLDALTPAVPTGCDMVLFEHKLREAVRDACEWGFGDRNALESLNAGETLPPWPCEVKPLSILKRAEPGDYSELLRDRYLCRGGGALLVGPTGVGKSSLSMQCAITWALGREAFGIMPARPLTSLFVQAENDEGDLAEMRDGVVKGIALSEQEQSEALRRVFIASEDSHSGPTFSHLILEPAVRAYRPDLVWIDPALAYLGGESNNQKDVGAFLRNQLNPIIHKYNCAAIVVHHTNKPNQNTAEWTTSQMSYFGGGSAEWANWARAILVLDAGGCPAGIFRLHAAKRGARLRWKEADGETLAYTKVITHARELGVICWRELKGDEATIVTNKAGKRQHTVEDVMPHVPTLGSIGKDTVVNRCNDAGMPIGKAKRLVAEGIEKEMLHEWRIPRPGTRPAIHVSRHKQEIQIVDTNSKKGQFVSSSAPE